MVDTSLIQLHTEGLFTKLNGTPSPPAVNFDSTAISRVKSFTGDYFILSNRTLTITDIPNGNYKIRRKVKFNAITGPFNSSAEDFEYASLEIISEIIELINTDTNTVVYSQEYPFSQSSSDRIISWSLSGGYMAGESWAAWLFSRETGTWENPSSTNKITIYKQPVPASLEADIQYIVFVND
ncbi:hypothetical protein [Marinitoga lauensis]|uniref:hypothetical protein n=1 Tax=Marinitoga lauensis TaxID=2201189 RepID=UPI001010981D|nr:hypothetical protein [Marinitoga lauensis]